MLELLRSAMKPVYPMGIFTLTRAMGGLFLITGLVSLQTWNLSAEELPDPFRLDRSVIPKQARLDLKLDARAADYSGSMSMLLQVKSPISSFRLHGRELDIQQVELKKEAATGAETVAVQLQAEQADFLRVQPSSQLTPGDYTLRIQFKNNLDTQAIGLYRVETGGESYVFSQFEASFARTAFPCFDEPGFKHPWQVTLTVPKEHIAVTNTPLVSETVVPEGKRLVFANSRPLPSYLLAFAAGPLEHVKLEGMSIPGNIYTTRGKLPFAKEALQATPPILKALETYFGRRYPFEKLDLIAAPEFMYGAMENPGAIVFREPVLLMDGEKLTLAQKAHMYEILTHELAHIWFGDFVTMSWWNDLWLNESFASWMATKIMTQLYPSLETPISSVNTLLGALGQDGRLSSRAIRRTVLGNQEALQRIGLAYSKGESVLAMFERWLGPEAFRKGVLSYLEAHAWGNAEGDALWQALEKVSGKPVSSAMASFLDLPGAPLVTGELVGKTELKLSQERMLLAGQTVAGQGNWQIPVVFRYPDGNRIVTDGVLLKQVEQIVPLKLSDKSHAPPPWVHLNVGEVGYYRWKVPGQQLLAQLSLTPAELSARERIALLNHASALVSAGELDALIWLELVSRLIQDKEPHVKLASLRALQELHWLYVAGDPALVPSWKAFVLDRLLPELTKMGWKPGDQESLEEQALRGTLIVALARWGEHEPTRTQAARLADQYFTDPTSLPPSLTDAVLTAAAIGGDRQRFEQYRQRFEQTPDPRERELFLSALGVFSAPELADAALSYSLSGPLKPQEIAQIAFVMAEGGTHQERVLEFVKQNQASLKARIAPPFQIHFSWLAAGCSEERFARWKPFFVTYANGSTEFLETIDEVAEAVSSCVGQRKRDASSIKNWFNK